jgi:hypothetical protein
MPALLAAALAACSPGPAAEYFVTGDLFPPAFCDYTVSFPGRPEYALVRYEGGTYPRATVRTSVFMTRAECAPRQSVDLTAALLAAGYATQYEDATIRDVDDAPGPAVQVSGSLMTEFGRVRDEYLIVEGPQSIMVLQTAGTEPRYPSYEVRNFLASLRPAGAPPPERLYEFPVLEPDRGVAARPPAPPAAPAPGEDTANGAAENIAQDSGEDAGDDPGREAAAGAPEPPLPALEPPPLLVAAPPPAPEPAAPEPAPPEPVAPQPVAPEPAAPEPTASPDPGSAAVAAAVPGPAGAAVSWQAAPLDGGGCRVSARPAGAGFPALVIEPGEVVYLGDGRRPGGQLADAAGVLLSGGGMRALMTLSDGQATGDAAAAAAALAALRAGTSLTVRVSTRQGPRVQDFAPTGLEPALAAAGCADPAPVPDSDPDPAGEPAG